MRGFQALPELLRLADATTVFGVLGSSNVPWIADGVYRGTLRLIKTRHEETAVSAAAGFGRVSGRLGVCSATRGPGFANSINPLAAAIHYHLPLLLIVGESPPSTDRSWQVLEQHALTDALGAGFHHAAAADELVPRFWEAVDAVAWNGLPQVLSIGDGVLTSEVSVPDRRPPVPARAAPPADRVVAAVDALAVAERPLILAGQGALLADVRADLERLGERIGARLGTTITVNRFFSGHPAEVGLVGASAAEATKRLVRPTDVVLAVGASLNGKTLDGGTLFPDATIIQCEIDPSVERRATVEALYLVGDARATVKALIAEWEARGLPDRPAPSPAAPTFDDLADRIAETDIGHDPRRGIDLRAIYRLVSQGAPADRIVVTDAGRSRATMAALVDARDARSWLDSMGYGSIGLGLGFAVGAAAAAPDRRVILFTGDVGFMMSSHDLDAMRLNHLDQTIVIRNDEQNGAELKYLAAVDLPTDLVRQSLPDVPTLARAFGGEGVVLLRVDDLDAAWLTRPGLVILDARIDPELDWRQALLAAS